MRKVKAWLLKDGNWVWVLALAIIIGWSIYALLIAKPPAYF